MGTSTDGGHAMWEYNYDELYHHGIKGQRWGVRRFQNEDGSLTPTGERRYNDSDNDGAPKVKKKSKHRLRLEENFQARGMTQEEAEAAAKKRIRTERIIAAAGAITLTACAAYLAKDKIKDRIGGVIKAGDDLQRVERDDTGGKLHDVFYMSKGKHDNARYKGLLGLTRYQQNAWFKGEGEAYLMKLSARDNIKIASNDKAAKVFGDLYKNDSDFRQSVEKYVSSHFSGGNKVDTRDVSPKNIRKMYDNFNAALVGMRREGSGADKKFYDKLKSAGYGAIRDVNDMKFSGYNAKNPLIVFNNANNNISVKSVKKMVEGSAIMAAAEKELAKSMRETEVDNYLTALSVGGIQVGTGLTVAALVSRLKGDRKRNANEDEKSKST